MSNFNVVDAPVKKPDEEKQESGEYVIERLEYALEVAKEGRVINEYKI